MSNSGILHCFDAVSGKKIWKFVAGRIGKGSPVWADGKIYLTTANGTFVILEDMGSRCRRLDSMSFEFGTGGREGNLELFGSPAVSDGRMVFTNTTDMICLGKDAGPRPVAVPPLPEESPVEADRRDAPGPPGRGAPRAGRERAISRSSPTTGTGGRSGRSRPNGRSPARAARSALKLGHPAVGRHGKMPVLPTCGRRVHGGGQGAIGLVTARSGSLGGEARVRIVPALPIAEDFESYKDGDVIGWWVGVSKAKHAIETLDGSKVLKKLSDDHGPIFNRSLVFITPPLPPGYTVEADVLGTKQGRRRGDVGLINDRYVLELFGSGQKLRVMSWIPGPRFEKKIDFPWDAGRWYRLKFKVDLVGDDGAGCTRRPGPATSPSRRPGPSRRSIRSPIARAPRGSTPTAPWRRCTTTT